MQQITSEDILFGNSHTKLTERIFNHLGLEMPRSTNCTYFANDEIRPLFTNSVRGKDMFIIQTGCSVSEPIKGKSRSLNDFIVEALLLISTCKRSRARSINLIMPHFPYARQDKKDSPRAAISASDICRMLYDSGVTEIVSFDLHNSAAQGFTTKPFNNVPCFKIIRSFLKDTIILENNENFCLGAPDESAAQRLTPYASELNVPMVYFSKERDNTRENVISESKMIGNKKYVAGRTVILIDDMIDTGGTMCKAAEILIEKEAKNVMVVATHGIFSDPAIDRINKCDAITHVYVSDSVPQKTNMQRSSKIKEFSISKTIAEIMTRIYNNKSVSEASCF